MSYIKDPMKIETTSFEIIEMIMREQKWCFPNHHHHIYKRVIHTSADFDYLNNLKVNSNFVDAMISAKDRPITLYTDTQMVLSGINKKALAKTKWNLKCFVSTDEAQKLALEKEMTRSMAAIDLALEESGEKIFVIGNAPTALYQLMEHADVTAKGVLGVIGVPVGFVGAAESKQALYESGIPSIVTLGRKGGSNIAATIINAILYDAVGRA